MKIAITADLHLRSRDETPHRYNALENICKYLQENNITDIFIAGDLFDKDFFNYKDFDILCENYYNVHFTIIPGNHDPNIKKELFSVKNLKVITKPTFEHKDSMYFLFIPFDASKNMDEVLSDIIRENNLKDRWALIGHGDYITSHSILNSYEEGVYMPLSSFAVNKHNIRRVFLGHIHKPIEFGNVFYPGSPFPIDISETGPRSFLLYNTENDEVKRIFIKTNTIYQDEVIYVYPYETLEDTLKNLTDKLNNMINRWNLPPEDIKKVKVRIAIKGWLNLVDSPKEKIKEYVEDFLQKHNIAIYEKNGLDLSEISDISLIENEKIFLFNEVKKRIETLNLSNFKTTTQDILQEAMQLIFIGKGKI